MILTKEAKEFIYDMVPECIKEEAYFFWKTFNVYQAFPKTSNQQYFTLLLKHCWNSLTMSDKREIFKNSYIDYLCSLAESIFNSPNDENEFLNMILDFKGFKGKVWE